MESKSRNWPPTVSKLPAPTIAPTRRTPLPTFYEVLLSLLHADGRGGLLALHPGGSDLGCCAGVHRAEGHAADAVRDGVRPARRHRCQAAALREAPHPRPQHAASPLRAPSLSISHVKIRRAMHGL